MYLAMGEPWDSADIPGMWVFCFVWDGDKISCTEVGSKLELE